MRCIRCEMSGSIWRVANGRLPDPEWNRDGTDGGVLNVGCHGQALNVGCHGQAQRRHALRVGALGVGCWVPCPSLTKSGAGMLAVRRHGGASLAHGTHGM